MPLVTAIECVYSIQGLLDLSLQAQAHVAAVGPWDLATVGLFKANVTPTPTMLLADLDPVVVGDWAEYLDIATTGWGAPETRQDGSVLRYATPLLSWTGPAAGGGPGVVGYFVKSPLAGTHFLQCGRFDRVVAMNNNSQILDFVLPFLLKGGAFTI